MELINKDGFILMLKEDMDRLRDRILEVRKTIIVFNKTGNENLLNKCCRKCNDVVKLIDEMFEGGI